jgi:succinate dehydrogenase / fumarate reductase flavoprotein subunit
MWEHAGVVRDADGIRRGLQKLSDVRSALDGIDVRPTSEGYGDLAHVMDLRASLASAEATLLGALERRETRGAHIRSDFPALDPALTVDLVVSGDPTEHLSVSTHPIAEIPEALRSVVEGDVVATSEGRLLE